MTASGMISSPSRMQWGYLVFVAIAIGLYTWFFIAVPSPTSDNQDWDILKNNIPVLWVVPCIATLCLFIGALAITDTPDNAVYLAMMTSCLTVGLSMAALLIAITSR